MAVASGRPPDLAIMSGLNVDWNEGGIIQPLTEFFQKDAITAEDLYPGFYEAMMHNGDLWTVPFQTGCETGKWP